MKLVLPLIVAFFVGQRLEAEVYTVDRGSDLQAAMSYAADGDTIMIGNKDFQAKATEFVDPLCGNCLDPTTRVKASYGFIVKGKALVLIGSKRSRLITNAGYGLYFENSNGSVVKNLTITGGRRDNDGNATDAAIVVRRSRVTIENVRILDNDNRSDDTTVVVGIGGIIGREGAELTISDCRLVNNGWDGIALYRGATATISNCLIKDGRGAGIGVTWDACAMVYRNEISGYWKGIGAFGTAWVIAHNNIVHDNLGWGIIATGKSFMDIANNVVHHNGNCGVAPWSTESRGRIVNNIITENGWREKWVCPCVGVWNYGDWAKWEFAHNIVWNNKAGNYEDIWDQSGLNGNQDIDPLFVGDGNYRLQDNSPALNTGDSAVYNPDGTVSHIGIYGGPQAWDPGGGYR